MRIVINSGRRLIPTLMPSFPKNGFHSSFCVKIEMVLKISWTSVNGRVQTTPRRSLEIGQLLCMERKGRKGKERGD
jgi:hypothetical protein